LTASTLPEPFVPFDVDLNGYEFMPLYGERLRTSDHNSGCSDAEFRASINLWWSAWLQVPAASLPADDVNLTRLADLGRDLKAWRKVKAVAMRNFVLCSDGRYYHTFLAPLALKAWEERIKHRRRGSAGARARWSKHPQTMAQAVDKPARTKNLDASSIPRDASSIDSDASTKKNDSKGEESLSRNTVQSMETRARAPTADPEEKPQSKPRTSPGVSENERRLVAAGRLKGLTPNPGESPEAFESRVRTTRT
jgi:hypothetical protein